MCVALGFGCGREREAREEREGERARQEGRRGDYDVALRAAIHLPGV